MNGTGVIFLMAQVSSLRLDPTIGIGSDLLLGSDLIFFTHEWNGYDFFNGPNRPRPD